MSMPGGSRWYFADVLDALVHALERLQRVAAVAHEHDALHDVGVVVLADDAEARRASRPTRRATSRTRTGTPLVLGDDDVADVAQRADEADAAHVERLLAERDALAADVLVGVGDRASIELLQRQVLPLER